MSDDYRNAMRARGEQLLREANNGADPCRVSAFGAIRRAAGVARGYDADRDRLLRERPMTDYARFADWHDMRARAIRQAIRVAVGSDKA